MLKKLHFAPIILIISFCSFFNSFSVSAQCAGEGSSQLMCNAMAPISIADLISGESSGGSWWMTAYGSGGAFDPQTGIFTPDGQTEGIFMFSYFFSGDAECGDDMSTVTLTFASGDVSDSRAGHSCQGDSATFDLNQEIELTVAGQVSGGTWTRTAGTGGVFDAAMGTFDCTPEASSSTFVYSVAGPCGTFSCTFEVYRAQRPVPGAGDDGSMTVCQGTSGTINLHDVISGEEIYNPLWTRVSGTGGELDALTGIFTMTPETTTSVFKYRMASGAGMCGNDSSFATLVVEPCVAAQQGCAALFWDMNREKWCSAYNPSTIYGSVFENAPQAIRSKSLLQALSLKGSGQNKLASESAAALLNICSAEVSYPAPYSNLEDLVAAVDHAYEVQGKVMNRLAAALADVNELECPLDQVAELAAKVMVYPNPFREKISVSIDPDYKGEVSIEIYDVLGRLMSARKADASTYMNQIDFETGFIPQQGQLYLIKVTTDKGSSVIKSIGG